MFVDELTITLKAGHGGSGKTSFYKPPQKGPDGGNGGKGGDIYIRLTSDLTALKAYSHKRLIEAENGQAGGSKRMFGLNGKDIEITLPQGVTITDLETGEKIDLDMLPQRMLICKGGLGGRGNHEFKSSRNTTPEYAQPGLEGDQRTLLVILKLIADFGLIGLPNAGKSSLLNELTRTQAKVADYPFTTLEPNLGNLRHHQKSIIIADIPGLIEGASSGKGLGIKFLKHIEKTTTLLHCISTESENPLPDYKTVRNELEQYNPELLKKPEIILLTKSDQLDAKKIKSLITKLKPLKKKITPVSIYDYDSMEKLKELLVNP